MQLLKITAIQNFTFKSVVVGRYDNGI